MSDGPAPAVECVAHSDGSMHQLSNWLIVHVLRNPHGWTEDAVLSCRLFAADIVERDILRTNLTPRQRQQYRSWTPTPLEPPK